MNSFVIDQIKSVSFFGNGLLFPFLIFAVYSAYFWYRKYKREAILLISSVFSYVYTSALKLFFQHERPSLEGVPLRTFADVYSFPSGHVIFYVSFFGFLVYVALTSKKLNKWVRIITASISTYLILLVGASRVLLGVHWVKDVLAGYMFGIVYLAVMIFIDLRLEKKSRDTMTEYQKKDY